MEDYVERVTAVARKGVEDAETEIKQKQEDMSNVEQAGLTTRKPEKTFEEMLNAIGDSLSDLPSSNDEEENEANVEDDEDTGQGKLSEDDEPGLAMGTISKTVQHRMERFWQKQTKLHKLTQPGWGDAADYFRKTDTKYAMTELNVPPVIKSQMDQVAAAPPPTTFGELIETPDLVPEISRMLRDTSRPESRHVGLGAGKPQPPELISSLPPGAPSELSQINYVMPLEPVTFYHCILPPELSTILISHSDEDMVTAPVSAEE